ncbi:putative transposase [Pseudomonas syringae pv. pisi]|uniref:Putative transposase n=1 Tax=Pseudomonas savastanoi pv. phaseolicola TaxID=319 RepID=A0A7Z6Y9P8_PSESH|nr:putative transposase [Pseudomonas syringae pv. pisi]RML65362.1 putative transposase [Pseudomonas syringae pv. pisi]RMU91461.1 putative transposase [Pseudomonas savastanoi pv. phaseolicola]
MSLIQSARLNGHDPYAYMKDVLKRLPTQRASEIEQLLPHMATGSNRGIGHGRCSSFARVCQAQSALDTVALGTG